MLKLKNIEKNSEIISAEYDPEDSGRLGKVVLDAKSGNLLNYDLSEIDTVLPIYLNHAIDAVKELRLKEFMPKEKTVMWH